MVALMGDLVGAFPKTWRELVVVLAKLEAQVSGPRLVLLAAFLRNTAVEVSYSGCPVVETESGLPEGGMLGPLCYPLLPQLLDKSLAAAEAGVAVHIPRERWGEFAGSNAIKEGSASILARLDASA